LAAREKPTSPCPSAAVTALRCRCRQVLSNPR
jgi:hypothetical protein